MRLHHPRFPATTTTTSEDGSTDGKSGVRSVATSSIGRCNKCCSGVGTALIDGWRRIPHVSTHGASDFVPEISGCSHAASTPHVSCMPFKEIQEMPHAEASPPLYVGTSSLATMVAGGLEMAPCEVRTPSSRQECSAALQTAYSLEDPACTDSQSVRGLEGTTCTTATEDSTYYGVSSSCGEEERWCNPRTAELGREDGRNLQRASSLKAGSGDIRQECSSATLSLQKGDFQNMPLFDLSEDGPRALRTLDTDAPADRGKGLSFMSEGGEANHSQGEAEAHTGGRTEGAAPKKGKTQGLLIPCVAVFASNYNFTVTSIALFLISQDPKYHASRGHVGNSTVKMLSYAGAIFGMCTMGYLGDLIGRRRAMVFTLSLVCTGALLSSVCPWGDGVAVLTIMGIFRFLLGVGSGGVYPLSAVSAAEGAASEQTEERSMRVSWAYSMNVPGIMFPYILALFLWWCTHNVDICFRVLLAFGALPVLVILLPAWKAKGTREGSSKDLIRHFASVFVTRRYWRQLLGTGICWLLYDVTAYGILLVQPELTETIWGGQSSVLDVIWQNIALNAMGIPGCFMGIFVLRNMGVKWLQFWGFVGLAASAFLLAAAAAIVKNVAWVQIVLLCVVNYFINWGASITTFILPSLVFPPEVRSTYSGISAALGKIGAVAGIYMMKAILIGGGPVPMMISAGVPSLLAALLTWWYVDPVPKTMKSSFLQCFGSLAAVCPFVDCRKGTVRRISS